MTTLLLSLLPALWAWDPLPSAPSTLDALEFPRGRPTATTVRGPGPRSGVKSFISVNIIADLVNTVYQHSTKGVDDAEAFVHTECRLVAASMPAQPLAVAPPPHAGVLPSSVSLPSSARERLHPGSLFSGVPVLHEHQADVLLRSHRRAQAGHPLCRQAWPPRRRHMPYRPHRPNRHRTPLPPQAPQQPRRIAPAPLRLPTPPSRRIAPASGR